MVSRYMIHGMIAAPKGKYLGLRARYLPSKAQFGGSVIVEHPLYKVTRWSEAEFYSGFHTNMSGLGIKGKSVRVVDVQSGLGREVMDPGALLFVRNKNQIITQWDGAFYLLDRVGPPCGEKYRKAPWVGARRSDVEGTVRDVKAALRVPVSQVRLAALVDVAGCVGDHRFLSSALLRTINARGPVTEHMFTELVSGRPRFGRKLHDRLVQDYYLFKDNER